MSKNAKAMALVPVMMLIGACVQDSKTIWVRADGKRGAADPALVRQFEADGKECTQAGADHVNATCMSQRGYVLVPEEQAETKRLELAEAAKARREAAANAAIGQPNR